MKRAKTFLSKEQVKNLFNPTNLKEMFKPTRKKVAIVSAVLVVAIISGILFGRRSNPAMNTVQAEDVVTRGDITVTITGSASVEPLERFEIIPKVSGDIVYCPYEVGDAVSKDDILYMFDTSDTDLTVERQRISMQQSENSYQDALKEKEKLYIKAKNDGVISGLTIKEGQEVNSGTKVATIEDTENLEVEVPFTGAQIDSIFVGDTAVITSSKHMSTVSGTVTHKSSSAYPGGDGTALYNVIIEFKNPGAFYAGMEVGAGVNGHISPGKGTITTMASGTVSTETDGTVVSVDYKNGDYVTKGTVIATLKSDTITDRINDSTLSYKSANISMRQTEKSLEDYNIKSPINGTVITKNAKAGDTIDKTNSASTLMVVADVSKLKFELAIDELDVSKVHEGQDVYITCDALPDDEFSGKITNVSVEGTASNGVTTYSAQVEIEEPGNLRPSMNIDAEIIIESAENVLMVPTEDIKTVGGRSFVFVKDDGKTKTEEKDNAQMERPQMPEGIEIPEGAERPQMPEGMEIPESAERPQMPEGMEIPEGVERPEFNGDVYSGENMPKLEGQNKEAGVDGTGNKTKNGTNAKKGNMYGMTPQAPEGYIAKEIVIGVSNEDYTEVKSGLDEGDLIYKTTTATSTQNSMMPGRMGGNMSGGMPGGMSGGMGGGMPSGGMPSGGMPGGMR